MARGKDYPSSSYQCSMQWLVPLEGDTPRKGVECNETLYEAFLLSFLFSDADKRYLDLFCSRGGGHWLLRTQINFLSTLFFHSFLRLRVSSPYKVVTLNFSLFLSFSVSLSISIFLPVSLTYLSIIYLSLSLCFCFPLSLLYHFLLDKVQRKKNVCN